MILAILSQQRSAGLSSTFGGTGGFQTSKRGAEKILFNIEGGRELSMLEVNSISKLVSDQNPKAKIIFGISKNKNDYFFNSYLKKY